MSNSTLTKKAEAKLTNAELLEDNLRTALAKAGNLVALRKQEQVVAEKQETAKALEENMHRQIANSDVQSKRITDADTKISTIEEQIARLQKQLRQEKAERDEAAICHRYCSTQAEEFSNQLSRANNELQESEEAAARAKEAVDNAPMTLMERLMAFFAS